MSVTTLYAAALSSSSITLNGTLDDLHGEASLDVSFEWGATSSYGNETTPETVTETGLISAEINASSLDDFHTDGSTYHFRAKATDGVTTWYGIDRYLVNLNTLGSDPYVIDNDMSSGTLTNTVIFNDTLLLDWEHGTLEKPEFFGAIITEGFKGSIMTGPKFSGVIITEGSKGPIMTGPEFFGAILTGGTII